MDEIKQVSKEIPQVTQNRFIRPWSHPSISLSKRTEIEILRPFVMQGWILEITRWLIKLVIYLMMWRTGALSVLYSC